MAGDFGLTNDTAEINTIQNGLNPLPRSVRRRTPYLLLDDVWKFNLDIGDDGLREMWYLGHEYALTAPFPRAIEAHLAAAKDVQQHTPLWQDELIAWYEREFSIPETWTSSSPHSLVQVTFGACGYETRVWLNGYPLKTIEGEEIHLGEYNSFSYELPPEYLRPVNRLTIRIADSLDAEIPRGKQQSHVYKRGGIWYQTISGAVRSVWLEPVERNRLRSRLNIVSSLRDHLVEFDITPRIHDPGIYTLRLTVSDHNSEQQDEEKPIASMEFKLPLQAGEQLQRVPMSLPNAKIWSPASPNLYHLRAELIAPDDTTTGIETKFGLRKIAAHGHHIYFNNDPLYLDGILYQPGTSTYEEMCRHMHAMKELGCNLVRIHIAGIDPRIYELADQIGMLLWVEVPSPHSSTQRSRDNHWAELQRMLVFIASHPSVCIWSLYNEDWGVQDISTNIETRRYIASTYDYMRVHYPQVLVVDNDGWNHVSRRGRLKSDLLTAHVYTPEIERWEEVLDKLVAGETQGVTAQPLVVGDAYFYRGQVPLVISEWGGFGFADYGGPDAAGEKSTRIRAFKRTLRQRPIAGDIYTQATSIEQEENGIIDPHTGALLIPAGVLNSRDESPTSKIADTE
ncbi:MAG: glycoside hydrolase family 2 [Pyrinomonadaceae bacterium]